MVSFLKKRKKRSKKRSKKEPQEEAEQGVDKEAVDDFTQRARAQRLRELRGRGAKETKLWDQWNRSGRRDEHLVPLLQSLDPFIKSKARTYARQGDIGIPQSAVEAELRRHAIKGIKDYDPNRGTKLTTHIGNKFLAMSDFVSENRNFAHIPKARFQKFQQFRNAQMELEQNLGRPPTTLELQQTLQWPNVKDVSRMEKEIKSELFVGEQGEDEGAASEIRSMIQLMPSLLQSQDEKKVFGALFPAHGGEPRVKEVARRLGMPEQRVYQIRARILKRAQPYLKKI